MDIKSTIENLIREALKNLDIEAENISLEHPTDLTMGDFSTNIAMALAKNLKTNPKDLAEKIVEEINKNLPENISKVEAKNGFINFYLSADFFHKNIEEILKDKNFGKNNLFEGKKIMVEYTDPNPFKPFHIGHLMSNTIGESIARLVEFSGAKTIHANYQGDVGLHVAKAIYGLIQKGTPDPNLSIQEQSEYIGNCYSFASNLYEENVDIKKEIEEINKKVYDKSDEKINELYQWGRSVTLEAFEIVYKTLGTKFEHYFFESEMAPVGLEIVKENTGKVFEESDGAVVFKGEKYDSKLHTRVFINSQGLPTYETKEIGLTVTKFEKENPDLSIVITAIEQGEYMRVVQKAISLIHPNYESRMKHITHGMLRFASGKMSSRKGNIITGESLISDVSSAISEKIKDRDFGDEEKKEVASCVGVAALKYSILKQSLGGDIIYDFEKSISFEGDSGPYLQYSYARANSVLEKAKTENLSASFDDAPQDISEPERLIYRFPEIVLNATEKFEPHNIANYLIELARAYNSYYGNTKILDSNDNFSPYKIGLTEAFAKVMKHGLYLLGIKTPERM